MNLSRALGCVVILLVGMASGCGGDPRELVISKTIGTADDTRSAMKQIRDALEKITPDRLGKTAEINAELDTIAKVSVKELKKKGEFLTFYKKQCAILGETTTDSQRKALAEANGTRLEQALKELHQESEMLDVALAKTKELVSQNQDVLSHFDKMSEKLKKSRDSFEILTRSS